MPSNLKERSTRLTDAQVEALEQYASAHDLTTAELIRYALAVMIPDWPNNTPQHGGKRLKSEIRK